jgi:hypothetical protein
MLPNISVLSDAIHLTFRSGTRFVSGGNPRERLFPDPIHNLSICTQLQRAYALLDPRGGVPHNGARILFQRY